MKKTYIIPTAFFAALILFAGGCEQRGGGEPQPKKERAWVRMTGGLPAPVAKASSTRADTIMGPIEPDAYGLPSKQLDVAIVTVNHKPVDDPAVDLPGFTQWAGHQAETTRGFFGSNDAGEVINYNNPIDGQETVIKNGLIEYVNEAGEYIQRVFYPDTENEYYYVRVAYPYQGMDQLIQMPDGTGAALVFSGLTGHEDILCSNIGWGCQTQPIIETNEKIDNPDDDASPEEISILKFSHVLAQLRFWVVVESEIAQQQYVEISELIVRFQPDKVLLRMIDAETVMAPDATLKDFKSSYFLEDGQKINFNEVPLETKPAPGEDPEPEETPEGPVELDSRLGEYAGYVMVMPDYTYRIEANTKRMWIGADYIFKVDPEIGHIEPGKIYDVVLKFKEAYKLEIEVSEAAVWWMDSVFD